MRGDDDGRPGRLRLRGHLGAGGRGPRRCRLCRRFGAEEDLLQQRGHILGLAVLDIVDEYLRQFLLLLLVVEQGDQLQDPLHVAVRVDEDHVVALGDVHHHGVGGDKRRDQLDHLRRLEKADGDHLKQRLAGERNALGIAAVDDGSGLPRRIAHGNDPEQAAFLHHRNAVEPENDLQQRQDILLRHRGNGPERHPTLDARVDDVVLSQNVGKNGLDHRINVGIVKVQADLLTAPRRHRGLGRGHGLCSRRNGTRRTGNGRLLINGTHRRGRWRERSGRDRPAGNHRFRLRRGGLRRGCRHLHARGRRRSLRVHGRVVAAGCIPRGGRLQHSRLQACQQQEDCSESKGKSRSASPLGLSLPCLRDHSSPDPPI